MRDLSREIKSPAQLLGQDPERIIEEIAEEGVLVVEEPDRVRAKHEFAHYQRLMGRLPMDRLSVDHSILPDVSPPLPVTIFKLKT